MTSRSANDRTAAASSANVLEHVEAERRVDHRLDAQSMVAFDDLPPMRELGEAAAASAAANAASGSTATTSRAVGGRERGEGADPGPDVGHAIARASARCPARTATRCTSGRSRSARARGRGSRRPRQVDLQPRRRRAYKGRVVPAGGLSGERRRDRDLDPGRPRSGPCLDSLSPEVDELVLSRTPAGRLRARTLA